jgi:hypothetical protein
VQPVVDVYTGDRRCSQVPLEHVRSGDGVLVEELSYQPIRAELFDKTSPPGTWLAYDAKGGRPQW